MKYDELILNIPLYHGELVIVVTDDLDSFNEKYDTDAKGLYGTTFMVDYEFRQLCLIVLNPYDRVKLTHGVISHEAVHAANMIFQARDIKLDLNNDEPYAYFVEAIVNEVYKFLKTLKVRLNLERDWK